MTTSTREGLLAPAFGAFMVRNLRATAVDGEAAELPVEWSGRGSKRQREK